MDILGAGKQFGGTLKTPITNPIGGKNVTPVMPSFGGINITPIMPRIGATTKTPIHPNMGQTLRTPIPNRQFGTVNKSTEMPMQQPLPGMGMKGQSLRIVPKELPDTFYHGSPNLIPKGSTLNPTKYNPSHPNTGFATSDAEEARGYALQSGSQQRFELRATDKEKETPGVIHRVTAPVEKIKDLKNGAYTSNNWTVREPTHLVNKKTGEMTPIDREGKPIPPKISASQQFLPGLDTSTLTKLGHLPSGI